jgi:hypothetical protein
MGETSDCEPEADFPVINVDELMDDMDKLNIVEDNVEE